MTKVDNIYDKLRMVVGSMRRRFTTNDAVNEFKRIYRRDYEFLVREYGEGGAGGGSPYSSRNYIGLTLLSLSKQLNPPLRLIDYIDAPSDINWGNPEIAYWEKV